MCGCSGGAQAGLTFSFSGDGSFAETVSVSGVALDEAAAADLQATGWSVSAEDSFEASRRFASSQEYADTAGVLYARIAQALVESAGYDPGISGGISVTQSVTDYVLFERHDVTIELPALDLAPTECLECDGSGSIDCPDCIDGTQTCSECDGAGGSVGWGGWDECWYCDGAGHVDCGTCEGECSVRCELCDGTGDVPESTLDEYRAMLDESRLTVDIQMPGILASQSGGTQSSWSLTGDDIGDGGAYVASSYVVHWRNVLIVAGIVFAVLLTGVLLVARAMGGRAKRRSSRYAAAVQATTIVWDTAVVPPPLAVRADVTDTDNTAESAGAPEVASPSVTGAHTDGSRPSQISCGVCGAASKPDMRFCRSCGASLENEVQ